MKHKSRRQYLTHYKKIISEKERLEVLEFAQNYSPSVNTSIQLQDKLGIRVSETLNIKIENIDFDQHTIMIKAKKQNKNIIRIMPKCLEIYLKEHIQKHKEVIKKCDRYICFAYGHGSKAKHIQRSSMSWFWKHFRETYNYLTPYHIRKGGKPLFRFSNHTMRSIWITKFYEASGHNLSLTQDEIGHADGRTTMGYIRYSDRHKRTKTIVNAMF